MTDFYIFRHGDTIETEDFLTRIFGHKHDSHNITILPKATTALKRVGTFLKNVCIEANFCSPYIRCLESVQIVGNVANIKYKLDERLRELEKKGETFSEFRDRVRSFLDEIRQKDYSKVSICTHGAVIGAIKHLQLSGKLYFFQVYDYPPPGHLVIIKKGSVSQLDFNH
jgi:broad specificity phosphatase PhoE